jgi:anti-sigma-K factor RskA
VNIKEYISSGIVESYVLGLADKAEREEFEQMCAKHAEVKAAREAFEIMLEQQLLADAAQAPATLRHLRQSIFAEIAQQKPSFKRIDTEARPSSAQVKLLPVGGWIKYLAAASVALLIVSIALNIYLFSQYKNFSSKYASLLASQSRMADNNKAMQTRLEQYGNTIAMFKDTNMAVIKMEGSRVPGNASPAPSSLATVLWDTRSKDVFLMVNNLPPPAAEHQYQLWAIVDGKTVDAGVFDMHDGNMMVRMKNIPRAQAFAVTLEKKGGNPTPQGKMYVLGSI